ncbi:long-chain-fatty-acid--CoA ligase [Alphaproteobacteria bacterium]|nr:long-chain-fatty-acid--CoA ligase [Alphaproteobacteria bacterium]
MAEGDVTQPLLIRDILAKPLLVAPHAEIVSAGHGRFSYREFATRINRLAHALTSIRIGRGDTVAVLDWDTHRYLECFFAVPMLGAILHTVNIRLSPAQILYTINHAKDDVIIVHADFWNLLVGIAPQIERDVRFILVQDGAPAASLKTGPDIVGVYEEMLAAAAPHFDFAIFSEQTVATTFYTTGTTGDPKGVSYTHRQLVLHTLSILAMFGPMAASNQFDQSDVYMPITPMFHVHAWGFPYAATLLGVKQVYPGRYDPAHLLQLIDQERASFSHCVPTILHMLLQADPAQSIDLSHWKVVIGGSSLPHGLAASALARGINVFAAYGLSETCPLLTVAQIDPDHADDLTARCCAGWPAPMVDLRIVDDNMVDVPRDGASTGEIVARAPWLTEGYVGNKQATAELWRGGYLHTGDVGRFDDVGRLLITDRIKDVIKSGGEWISSLSLESLVSSCDDVAEVAAIAVPDVKWGERPLLLIVPVNAAASDRLDAAIRQLLEAEISLGRLSKWAMPERIEIVADIPKTSVGKLDKKAMRHRYAH